MNTYFKLLLILSVLLVLTLTAFADSKRCPDHPWADTYEDGTSYGEVIDSKYHWSMGTWEACSVCSRVLWYHSPVKQKHWFMDEDGVQVCRECWYVKGSSIGDGDEHNGHSDSAHNPSSNSNQLSREELKVQALRQGDSVIGQQLKIFYKGNIRLQPNQDATRIGTVKSGDSYLIEDFVVIGGSSPWFAINYQGTTAWVSATLGSAEASSSGSSYEDDSAWYNNDNEYSSYLIGRTCVIIAKSSAKIRLQPDADAPVIGYAKRDRTFTILDVQNASNGTPWYQIEKDGVTGWVASTMTQIR